MWFNLFVCLFIQLLDITPWLSQCHYDANDPSVCLYLNYQLNCMASPFPDLYYEGFGLVLLSLNNMLQSKTLSQLSIC